MDGGVATHEAGLVGLDPADHRRLAFNRLGTEHKGETTLAGQGCGHFRTGYGLHTGRHDGNIQPKTAGFASSERGHRCGEGDITGEVILARQSGKEEVLGKSAGNVR